MPARARKTLGLALLVASLGLGAGVMAGPLLREVPGLPRPAVVRADRRWIPLGGALALVVAGLGLVLSARRPRERGPAVSPPAASPPAAAPPPARPPEEPSAQLPMPVGGLPRTPIPTPEQPQVFGAYRLLHHLGTGGMSEVYGAVREGEEGGGRRVAIKRLRPELVRDPGAVAQFGDEARLQASLRHPNIVAVLEFGAAAGEAFMAEEYVVGRDLLRLCERHVSRRGRHLDPRVVLYVAHQTLAALAYAHAKTDERGRPLHVVHRDVTPMNILVSGQGEVKLFDFGIAKSARRMTSTQVGFVKGNSNFMSPEQARGLPLDGRSDLFSLGVVIHYCLTGALLYKAETELDTMYRAAAGPTEADLARIDELPAPAGPIVRRALAFDPEARYPDARAFAQVIEPHVEGAREELRALMDELFGHELARLA
jgi:serine/threonine protein kinase